MEKTSISNAVKTIKESLMNDPFDAAHDFDHHLRVYRGCQKIAKAEHLSVNWKVLTIAAWGHDLGGRTGDETKRLEKILAGYKYPQEFINRVLSVIREHSFGKKQDTLEGRVLYDADKLEYVSSARLTSFLIAAKKGLLSDTAVFSYKRQWADRIDKVINTLHYSYSKQEFYHLLPAAERIMKKI